MNWSLHFVHGTLLLRTKPWQALFIASTCSSELEGRPPVQGMERKTSHADFFIHLSKNRKLPANRSHNMANTARQCLIESLTEFAIYKGISHKSFHGTLFRISNLSNQPSSVNINKRMCRRRGQGKRERIDRRRRKDGRRWSRNHHWASLNTCRHYDPGSASGTLGYGQFCGHDKMCRCS